MGQHQGGRNEEHDLIARYANRLARFQCLIKIRCPIYGSKERDENRIKRQIDFTFGQNQPHFQFSWLGDEPRGRDGGSSRSSRQTREEQRTRPELGEEGGEEQSKARPRARDEER